MHLINEKLNKKTFRSVNIYKYIIYKTSLIEKKFFHNIYTSNLFNESSISANIFTTSNSVSLLSIECMLFYLLSMTFLL